MRQQLCHFGPSAAAVVDSEGNGAGDKAGDVTGAIEREEEEPAAGAVDEDGAELSVCLTLQVQVAIHTHTHVIWLSRVHNSDTKSATKSLISAKKMT